MSYEIIFCESSNKELIKIMKILDELMEMDEHLLKTNPHLRYEPFKFHNRMLRSLAWSHLKNMSFDEHEQYNYQNLRKEIE